MLRGLSWLHSHGILHRDLTPQNLLVQPSKGLLKLSGFAIARTFATPLRTYTHEVVTLWYRPPEILLGARRYGCPVDAWSAGCVLSEMSTGEALFRSDSEIDTLYRIFRLLGTPPTGPGSWVGTNMELLCDWNVSFPQWRRQDLSAAHAPAAGGPPALDVRGLALFERLLEYDPSARLSCEEALAHPYYAGFDHHTYVGRGPPDAIEDATAARRPQGQSRRSATSPSGGPSSGGPSSGGPSSEAPQAAPQAAPRARRAASVASATAAPDATEASSSRRRRRRRR